jgi:hypothetical protein
MPSNSSRCSASRARSFWITYKKSEGLTTLLL